MKTIVNAGLCLIALFLTIESAVRYGRWAGWTAAGLFMLVTVLTIIYIHLDEKG